MSRPSILVIALLLSGCGQFSLYPGLYSPPVEQGNLYDQETIERLEVGMNKEQVHFLLGSPMLQSPFRRNRWDYVYYLKNTDDSVKEHHMVLWFEDGQLVFWEDLLPLEVPLEEE